MSDEEDDLPPPMDEEELLRRLRTETHGDFVYIGDTGSRAGLEEVLSNLDPETEPEMTAAVRYLLSKSDAVFDFLTPEQEAKARKIADDLWNPGIEI